MQRVDEQITSPDIMSGEGLACGDEHLLGQDETMRFPTCLPIHRSASFRQPITALSSRTFHRLLGLLLLLLQASNDALIHW